MMLSESGGLTIQQRLQALQANGENHWRKGIETPKAAEDEVHFRQEPGRHGAGESAGISISDLKSQLTVSQRGWEKNRNSAKDAESLTVAGKLANGGLMTPELEEKITKPLKTPLGRSPAPMIIKTAVTPINDRIAGDTKSLVVLPSQKSALDQTPTRGSGPGPGSPVQRSRTFASRSKLKSRLNS